MIALEYRGQQISMCTQMKDQFILPERDRLREGFSEFLLGLGVRVIERGGWGVGHCQSR